MDSRELTALVRTLFYALADEELMTDPPRKFMLEDNNNMNMIMIVGVTRAPPTGVQLGVVYCKRSWGGVWYDRYFARRPVAHWGWQSRRPRALKRCR